MASAALLLDKADASEPESAASAQPAVAWWRRGHTYAFVAALAVQVSGLWLMTKLVLLAANEWNSQVWIGLLTNAMFAALVGQCFLLGLWAALGGLATIPRWLVVGSVALAGIAAGLIGLEQAGEPEHISVYALASFVALAFVYTFAVILLPLRRLAGWRVDFDNAYHPPSGVRRGQLHLMDFVAMSCAITVPLTLCRMLMEFQPEEAEAMPIFLGVTALVATLVCGPPALAALVTQPMWLSMLAALTWTLILVFVVSLFEWIVAADLIFAGGGTIWGLNIGVTVALFSLACSVAGPLLFLRLFGLRLIRVA